MRSSALHGAIKLDLFTAIADGAKTVSAIAARIQASEKGTRVLCDFLTIIGFLNKQGDEYSLTTDSNVFLNRHSPAYMGTVSNFIVEIGQKNGAFDDMAALVRKGGTLLTEETVTHENPLWVNFARNMAPLMVMPAERIADLLGSAAAPKWKVLDIAAGHGLFGITIAKKNPNAHIVAVDWAPVLEVARENAVKAGVADRHTLLPGSAFDVDFGQGYDVALLTNFLHHFDVATNEKLLRKVYAALAPGGRVLTFEFIPDENRITPPADAMFAMTMLGSTQSGDAYTFAEYDRMFRNAGFARSEMHTLTPLPNRVIVSYK